MFTLDQVENIWPQAERELRRERERYLEVYKEVEEFLSRTPEAMLGGTLGVNLLLKKERGLEDYFYEIYSERSFEHANHLSNRISERVKESYTGSDPPLVVMLKTLIPYRRYQIFVDNRLLVLVVGLDRIGEGVKLSSVIEPLEVTGFDSKKFLVLSPEMQLIDIYRTLYSPNQAENWENALHDENQLFKLLLERRKTGAQDEESLLEEIEEKFSRFDDKKVWEGVEKVKEGLGILASEGLEKTRELATDFSGYLPWKASKPENQTQGGSSEKKEFVSRERFRTGVMFLLLKEFVQGNPHLLLLGDHALFLISGEEFPVRSKILQVVSERSPEEDFQEVGKLFQRTHPELSLSHTTRELHVMRDFRILRSSLKITEPGTGKQKEVLYIYNSGSFDLLPFNQTFAREREEVFQVGNPFVLLRFLLLDFWTVRWITAIGGMDSGYSKLRLREILDKLLLLRSKLSSPGGKDVTTIGKSFLAGETLLKVFQSQDYLGRFEDEVVSQKEKIKELARRYGDYYPQKHLREHGSYRELSCGEKEEKK